MEYGPAGEVFEKNCLTYLLSSKIYNEFGCCISKDFFSLKLPHLFKMVDIIKIYIYCHLTPMMIFITFWNDEIVWIINYSPLKMRGYLLYLHLCMSEVWKSLHLIWIFFNTLIQKAKALKCLTQKLLHKSDPEIFLVFILFCLFINGSVQYQCITGIIISISNAASPSDSYRD